VSTTPTDADLRAALLPERIPQHVAIIMDGNGRWAKQKGNRRIFGHQNALKAVRDTVEGAAELGVQYLTLYAFSTENWARPKEEVDALMNILVRSLRKEAETLRKNSIRMESIGDATGLPPRARRELQECKDATAAGTRMTLVLALNYGGRADLLQAIRRLAAEAAVGTLAPDAIDEAALRARMSTAWLPDPELLIRTSGEQRISNFLIWEIAYTELYITPILWPDFRRRHLYQALLDYQGRERRFGKTSEQLQQPQ